MWLILINLLLQNQPRPKKSSAIRRLQLQEVEKINFAEKIFSKNRKILCILLESKWKYANPDMVTIASKVVFLFNTRSDRGSDRLRMGQCGGGRRTELCG